MKYVGIPWFENPQKGRSGFFGAGGKGLPVFTGENRTVSTLPVLFYECFHIRFFFRRYAPSQGENVFKACHIQYCNMLLKALVWVTRRSESYICIICYPSITGLIWGKTTLSQPCRNTNYSAQQVNSDRVYQYIVIDL